MALLNHRNVKPETLKPETFFKHLNRTLNQYQYTIIMKTKKFFLTAPMLILTLMSIVSCKDSSIEYRK